MSSSPARPPSRETRCGLLGLLRGGQSLAPVAWFKAQLLHPMTSHPPFDQPNKQQTIPTHAPQPSQMIDTARNIISVNITYPATISDMAKDFIASCLRKHPGDRPTVLEMLHHPWIQVNPRLAWRACKGRSSLPPRALANPGCRCAAYDAAGPCAGPSCTPLTASPALPALALLPHRCSSAAHPCACPPRRPTCTAAAQGELRDDARPSAFSHARASSASSCLAVHGARATLLPILVSYMC